MRKIQKGSIVGIIIGSKSNAGWYTCHNIPELVFDPAIIDLLSSKQDSLEHSLAIAYEIELYCDEVYGERPFYGDTTLLSVKWVPVDSTFNVVCVDGWETVIYTPDGKLKA